MAGDPPDRDAENERVARLALERGYITQPQLREALAEQAREVAGGRQRPRQLDNILLFKGYLSNDQLVAIRESLKPAVPAALRGSPRAPAFPLFGKYQLVRELGRGGMGIVYEAVDTTLGRRVALKMMLTNPNADPKEAAMDEERFLREARLCAGLPKHPNIVSIHEVGALDGKRYLAMEFVEGVPMHEWRKSGSVSIRQQVALVRDALLALHHAHEHGLIHRDVKPHNVLVDTKNQPHVVDFGLAKTVGQDVSVSLTASGMVVGTPIYMSPEQAQGLKTVDRRTDLYAAGALLYELLTGRPPFVGETAIEILMKAAKNPVPRPSNLVKTKNHPAQDPAIEYICLRALEKKPRDRYQTAKDFAEDLTKWLKGEDVKVVVPVGTRRDVAARKRPGGRLLGVSVALALVALVAVFGRGSRPESKDARPGAVTDAGRPLPPEDLLKLIDVSRDRIQGRWTADSKGLVDEDEPEDAARPQALPHAIRLRIPYEPPEEYDLKIVATRLGSPESLNVCLIVGGRQAVVAVDGGSGSSSVLMGLNNKTEIASIGRYLETNKPATVLMVVRKSRVTVTVDGRYVIDWQGDPKVLGQHSFWTVPEGKTLHIGSFATSYRFHEILLTPVSGSGKRVDHGAPAVASKLLRAPPDAKEYGGHHYKLFPERLKWHEAGKRCEDMGGHLVTITSAEENAFVRSVASGREYWLGLTDEGHQGRWEWVTGEAVTFTDWAPGQPDNNKGAQHWVMASQPFGFQWDDTGPPNYPWAFICEWEPTQPLQIDLGEGVTLEAVILKSGSFTMGGKDAPGLDWQVDERPEHRVTITKGFALGKHEVTRKQFAAFAKDSGYKTEAEKEGKSWGWGPGKEWTQLAGNTWRTPAGLQQTDDHPATCISWNDAKAFCDWATTKAGKTVRLPTEAEWEYACRAGSVTRWSFGDREMDLIDHGWVDRNSGWSTHPVGQKEPNAWGLYDMHGNVWEWCQDWSGPYAAGEAVDPQGPAGGDQRILRGGDWAAVPITTRSACRSRSPASHRSAYNGFRVAVTLAGF